MARVELNFTGGSRALTLCRAPIGDYKGDYCYYFRGWATMATILSKKVPKATIFKETGDFWATIFGFLQGCKCCANYGILLQNGVLNRNCALPRQIVNFPANLIFTNPYRILQPDRNSVSFLNIPMNHSGCPVVGKCTLIFHVGKTANYA